MQASVTRSDRCKPCKKRPDVEDAIFRPKEPHYVKNRHAVLRMMGAMQDRATNASPLSRIVVRTKRNSLKLSTAGYMEYS